MSEASTLSCANTLIHGWIQRFGLPGNITSDNGTVFISKLWREIQKELGTKIGFTPPYLPNSLEAIKRSHCNIKSGLKTTLVQMGNESGDKWFGRLPWFMLWHRSAIQFDLGASPAELALGTNPNLPGNLVGALAPPNSLKVHFKLLKGWASHIWKSKLVLLPLGCLDMKSTTGITASQASTYSPLWEAYVLGRVDL